MSSNFWCDSRLIVTIEGTDVPTRVSVDKPYARIGSHPASDIVLNDTSLPLRCIYLHATEEGVFGLGLSSRFAVNRLFGNWLAPGDFINVGPYRISAEILDHVPVSQPKANLVEKLNHVSVPTIEAWSGGRMIGVVHLHRQLTVFGRRIPSNTLVNDDITSETHCVFYWHGGSDDIWVMDLASTNGTWKRGRRLQAATVRKGKSIIMGRVELVFTGFEKSARPTKVADQGAVPDEASQLELPELSLNFGASSACGETQTSLALDDVDLSNRVGDGLPPHPDSCLTDGDGETSSNREDLQGDDRSANSVGQPEEKLAERGRTDQQLQAQVIKQDSRLLDLAEQLRNVEDRGATLSAEEQSISTAREAWNEGQTRQQTEIEKQAAELALEQESRKLELSKAEERLQEEQSKLLQDKEKWSAARADEESRLAEQLRSVEDRGATLSTEEKAISAAREAWNEEHTRQQAEIEKQAAELANEEESRKSELSKAEERLQEEHRKLLQDQENSSVARADEEARLAEQLRSVEDRGAMLSVEDKAISAAREAWNEEQARQQAEIEKQAAELAIEHESRKSELSKAEERLQVEQRKLQELAAQEEQRRDELMTEKEFLEQQFRQLQAQFESTPRTILEATGIDNLNSEHGIVEERNAEHGSSRVVSPETGQRSAAPTGNRDQPHDVLDRHKHVHQDNAPRLTNPVASQNENFMEADTDEVTNLEGSLSDGNGESDRYEEVLQQLQAMKKRKWRFLFWRQE